MATTRDIVRYLIRKFLYARERCQTSRKFAVFFCVLQQNDTRTQHDIEYQSIDIFVVVMKCMKKIWRMSYGLQIEIEWLEEKIKQAKNWTHLKMNFMVWTFFLIHRINHHHFTITTTTLQLLFTSTTTTFTSNTTISLWPVCCNYICLVKCPFSARLTVSTHTYIHTPKQANKQSNTDDMMFKNKERWLFPIVSCHAHTDILTGPNKMMR